MRRISLFLLRNIGMIIYIIIVLLIVYRAFAEENTWYRWSKVEAVDIKTNTLRYRGRWEVGGGFLTRKECIDDIKHEYQSFLTTPGVRLSNLNLEGTLGRYIHQYGNGESGLVSSGCFPANEDPNIGIIKK